MNLRRYNVAYRTIVIKEVSRFMRIWVQTILPPAITMALYFVIFGGLIGPRVGNLGGYPYIQYIAPGIIMMAVITNSYANVVSSFFGSKFQKHIEEMLVAPIPDAVLLAGYVSGGVLRGLLVGLAVTGVALFFTDLHIAAPGVTLSMIVLTATLFSLAGFVNGMYAKKFDDISIIPTFVLTPLTYLGGVFYSIDMLPPFWHGVSLFNPVVYMVDAFRYGLLGTSELGIVHAFIVVGGCTIALVIINLHLLARGVGLKS